ncbi:unnamed protein product, partial [Oppiella nova]
MVDKLCISRYARDYRTIAKAMFKHSDEHNCSLGPNILQLNDSTVCSLRSPDLRKGQRLIFYYMGRPIESEDDFLGKNIMKFVHFNTFHDYNNENTTGGVQFELPIYQYISYKELKAPLNVTSLFVTDLHHFTQYYIVLKICTHHNGVLTCKPVGHIKTKTLPS